LDIKTREVEVGAAHGTDVDIIVRCTSLKG